MTSEPWLFQRENSFCFWPHKMIKIIIDMNKIFVLLILPLLLFACSPKESDKKESGSDDTKVQENLDVFQQWIRWNNSGSSLMNHLIEQAEYFYDLRDKEIEKLKTQKDWEERQALVKNKLNTIMGSFPEKTPLNPQITGVLEKDGYRVEKILIEAMPDYFVSGAVFVPNDLKDKAPAIVNVIGHSQLAFRAELYQTVIINLVKKGMIVYAIDPPGQGERVQYFDPEIGLSSIGYSVIEHTFSGNQCFLSGESIAKYFTWEGIRAIDYLLTREDVDPNRIGVTGLSGGGTITSYISALDERVSVSVPCSWATACRRQLETKGAQDAETEFVNGVAEGITFEDLIEVRAPKPTLMTFTSRDQYLSLQGAREALWEAQKAYKAYGKEENIQLAEDDYIHWLTPKLREAIYSFFMQHFGLSGDPAEEEVQLLTPEELQVTETGQISTSLNSKLIFDVNKETTDKLISKLEESRKDIDTHLKTVKEKAIQISGYNSPGDEVIEPFINGRYQRDGYLVEKRAVRGEGNYAIPMLIFTPDDGMEKHPAVIYLHDKGKVTDALPGSEIEKLVKEGYVVAAADVLGVGELKDKSARGFATGFTGVLTGRSIPGLQAGDIVRVVNYMKSRPEVDSTAIGAVAIGQMCIALSHASAFLPSIENVVLVNPLSSYRAVVSNRFYKIGLSERNNKDLGHPYEVDFNWGIAGVLTGYDLPDLIACIAPRKVAMIGIYDQMLEASTEEVIEKDTYFPKVVYASKNAADNFRVLADNEPLATIVNWGFEN